MSEEKKINELEDGELEKVNGGTVDSCPSNFNHVTQSICGACEYKAFSQSTDNYDFYACPFVSGTILIKKED